MCVAEAVSCKKMEWSFRAFRLSEVISLFNYSNVRMCAVVKSTNNDPAAISNTNAHLYSVAPYMWCSWPQIQSLAIQQDLLTAAPVLTKRCHLMSVSVLV